MDKYWNPQWKTYGSVDGTFYSARLGSNMKSFVWYSPSFFKAKGYTVPTTWDELWTLSDKIAAGELLGRSATIFPPASCGHSYARG